MKYIYDYSKIGNRIRDERKKNRLSQDNLINMLRDKQISVGRNTLSAMENGVKEKFSFQVLYGLADIFQCQIGYLLCEYDYKIQSNAEISKITGLSDHSIEALRLLKSDVDNIDLFYNNELETLNFILENIRSKQEILNNGIGFTDSLLHYIGLYLNNDSIAKEPAHHLHYKYSDTKWASLKPDSIIDGNKVQIAEILCDNTNININDPQKLSVYDATSNQHYTLNFNHLMETYSKEKINEKLVELRQEKGRN